ncbi:immunity 49 family protein [Vibrio sp. Isolate25]|uniref:Imm49 family immunity protein n=1 Tax=Vibrio sp. Isolate25 TaxID=2908535 RepID=UPI001EFE27D0|nr:Imm49 family immunity protein [Vibrio sp. Isolate25]MCG9596569.1 immunity 49 family protein [Vibrio sp. Isolate25]
MLSKRNHYWECVREDEEFIQMVKDSEYDAYERIIKGFEADNTKYLPESFFFNMVTENLFRQHETNAVTAQYLYEYCQVLSNRVLLYYYQGEKHCQLFRHYQIPYGPYQMNVVLTIDEWLDALMMNVLLGDPCGFGQKLLRIPEENIYAFIEETDEVKDFRRVLFRLVRAFFIDNDPVPISERINDLVRYSTPEYVGEELVQDYTNYLLLPLAELLVSIHHPERETRYPAKLKQALECHIQYYTDVGKADSPSIKGDRKGWFAIWITALAAHAYEARGLEPTIDSEYMPLWLVKGEFPRFYALDPEHKQLFPHQTSDA